MSAEESPCRSQGPLSFPASPGSPGLSPLLREHWRTGYGTGVLRAYYVLCFMRGVTVGVVGTSSLFIAQRSNLPQHTLVAARGAGLTVGPVLLSAAIGKLALSGNSQLGFSMALVLKMGAELLIPRTTFAPFLYMAFFAIGLVMNYLDTSASLLVELVHGENGALPMLVYCAVYGIGSMVAPFITVAIKGQAWNVLAIVDFAVAAAISARRLGRGRPRGWKERVRQLRESRGRAGAAEDEAKQKLPRKVFWAGTMHCLAHQASETAMTSWAFTFATQDLGLSMGTAAAFPSTFYFAFTAARFVIIPATAVLLPSAIGQAGTLLSLMGTAMFFVCTSSYSAAAEAGATPEENSRLIVPILASLVIYGAGSCPQYAMMLASLRRHGEMDARDHGLFNSFKAFGMTLGMFLPGLVRLSTFVLLGSSTMFVVLTIFVGDFPWRQGADATERDPEGGASKPSAQNERDAVRDGLLELTCDHSSVGLRKSSRARRRQTWSSDRGSLTELLVRGPRVSPQSQGDGVSLRNGA